MTLLRAPNQIVVHDMSADGRLLVEVATGRETLQVFDRRTGTERDLSWLGGSLVAGISATGDELVIYENGASGAPQPGIYYRKTDGSPGASE